MDIYGFNISIAPTVNSIQAMATAHVLGRLLVSVAPERGWSPRVLAKDEHVSRRGLVCVCFFLAPFSLCKGWATASL